MVVVPLNLIPLFVLICWWAGIFSDSATSILSDALAMWRRDLPSHNIRTYDSRDKRTNDFGVGWSLDIKNVRLQKTRNLGANWNAGFAPPQYSLDSVKPRRISITLAGDKAYQFESVLTPSQQFGFPIESTRMTFTNLPATYGKLEIDGDNEAALDGFMGFVNLITYDDFSYFEKKTKGQVIN